MAARLFDEAIDLAKAEPRARSRVLGREERLERLGDDIRRHTRAGIGDGYDVLSAPGVISTCAAE